MCGRGRLFPDTEQPPQNAPHAAGRTPHHDLHALTSCHASTPRRRRSAETPPETSGTPPETRRRSGCPAPAPARRSPETSFRRHIVARYIPPLLQYMKERTRRAWRGGMSGTPSPTRGSTYRPVGRGPRAPPKNAHPAAGHMGPALQVHTPPPKKTTRRRLRGAARFPSMCGTDGGGLYSPLLPAGTAGEIPPKGGKGANLLGYDEPIAVLRGPATLAENDLTRFSVNGINSRNAGIVIPKRAAIDCNRAACSRVILMI